MHASLTSRGSADGRLCCLTFFFTDVQPSPVLLASSTQGSQGRDIDVSSVVAVSAVRHSMAALFRGCSAVAVTPLTCLAAADDDDR